MRAMANFAKHFNQQNTFMIAVMLDAFICGTANGLEVCFDDQVDPLGRLSSLLLRSSKDEPQFTATLVAVLSEALGVGAPKKTVGA